MPIHTIPEPSGFGARVTDVSLSEPLQQADADALTVALTRHGVLVVRGQEVDDTAHVRLARVFGEPAAFGSGAGGSSVPEVYGASNLDDEGRPLGPDSLEARLLRINWHWHIDGCYRRVPNRAVVLRCLEATQAGGQTQFCDLAGAYEALAPQSRRRLDESSAILDFSVMVDRCGLPPLSDEEIAHLPPIEQPLVRQHAGGRRSLFLSPAYMEHVVGLDARDSVSLIDRLTRHATQERWLYRHRWQPNDIVVWDNDWTMHRVTPYDIGHARRVMRGATILGREPVRPVSAAITSRAAPPARSGNSARG